jgi:hypothetical protein
MLPFRIQQLFRRFKTLSRKPVEAMTLADESREGDIELIIQDRYNESWKGTHRGSRITLVRSPIFGCNDKIMAIGSCFALEIRSALKKIGFDVYPKYFDIQFDRKTQKPAKLPDRDDINHYNTFTIRSEFERALNGVHLD